MSRAVTIPAPPQRVNRRFHAARVLLLVALIVFAGLFMEGIFTNVGQIVGESADVKTDFLVLFVGGALYAAGLLFIWYYSALILTNQWLDRLVKRLEAESNKPNNF